MNRHCFERVTYKKDLEDTESDYTDYACPVLTEYGSENSFVSVGTVSTLQI